MMNEKNNARVDFFAYTFKGLDLKGSDDDINDSIDELLPYMLPYPVYEYITVHNCEYTVMGVKGMGYKFRRCYDNLGVSIMCDGATDKHGTHIVLSGTILALCKMDRESFSEFYEFVRFGLSVLSERADSYLGLNEVADGVWDRHNISFNLSRIDIAYDFKIPFLDFYDRYENGCFERKSQKVLTYLDGEKSGTIYVGSRTSNCFIRIYDKVKQLRERNRKMLNLFSVDVPECCTRVEFEFKNSTIFKCAYQAFEAFIEGNSYIGNFCLRFLKVHDYIYDPDLDEIVISTELWDVYKSVILSNSNFENFVVEYDYSSRMYINFAYLQMVCNLLLTYCHKFPELIPFLEDNYKPSRSALQKCANVKLDLNSILAEQENNLVNVEVRILEHLLLHSDLLE